MSTTTANTSLRVSDLNFLQIKNNLKNYLRTRPQLVDIDFDGSNINVLLDVLSYNTYYNSFYLNMIANELFLDSTTLRESAVSRAKQLGYTPRSARSSLAQVTVTVNPGDSPNEIIVPRGTQFSSTLNGTDYIYTTLSDATIVINNGSYSMVLDIYEGHIVTYTFTASATQTLFEIVEPNIDTSLMRVYVKESSGASSRTLYSLKDDITDITATSTVYYLQENINGNYEIYFGDGVLGRALSPGNVIEIEAVSTNGSAANGIRVFTSVGNVGYNKDNVSSTYTAGTTTLFTPSQGGQDKETLSSIKFTAPRSYTRQNRNVTTSDYETFLLENFSYLESVSVWSGANNVPRLFGKTIISAKPEGDFLLTVARQDEIISEMEKRSILGIEPQFVNPEFTYINLLTRVFYTPDLTSLSVDSLFSKITSEIENFESEELSRFKNKFYLSKLISNLQLSDPSITHTDTSFLLEKRFTPILNSNISYRFNLNGPINNPYNGYQGAIISRGFTISGNQNTLYFDDDGRGNLRIYRISGIEKIYIDTTAGTIDYQNGVVTINSIIFSGLADNGATELRMFFEMRNAEYVPVRNEILLFSFPSVEIFNNTLQVVTKRGVISVLGNNSPFTNSSVIVS